MKRLITTLSTLALVSGSLLTTTPVIAEDSLPMNPGKWKITTKATSSMMPNPMTDVTTECIEDTQFDTNSLLDEMGDCQVKDLKIKGKRVSWKMHCNMDGTTLKGTGEARVENDKMSGQTNMQMSVQGMKMEMKTEWKGKRIGDC